MSQLKLIANDESAEDLCALIERLHTEMVEMRAELQRGFDVLLAVKTDDTEMLRKMIVSAPPAVVPFEDETEPVVEDKASSTSRNKMPAHIKQLSTESTRLANEGNDMIRQAHEMIAASTGHVSKVAQRLLDEGSQKLKESAKLKSDYGKAQKAAKKASRSK